MKILSVFDTAGVGAMITDKVVQLSGLDPFGFGKFYKNTEYFNSWEEPVKRALDIQDKFDKIIVHDYAQYLHRFPKEKTSIMYHGTMLRSIFAETDIDKGYNILLSTPDLKKWRPSGTIIGIPVDTKHFLPSAPGGGGKLCITIKRQVEQTRKDLPNDVKLITRDTGNIKQYQEMPKFLARYDEYHESKRDYSGNAIDSPSCTALQSLSLGLKVQVWGKILNGYILLEHEREYVRNKLTTALM